MHLRHLSVSGPTERPSLPLSGPQYDPTRTPGPSAFRPNSRGTQRPPPRGRRALRRRPGDDAAEEGRRRDVGAHVARRVRREVGPTRVVIEEGPRKVRASAPPPRPTPEASRPSRSGPRPPPSRLRPADTEVVDEGKGGPLDDGPRPPGVRRPERRAPER